MIIDLVQSKTTHYLLHIAPPMHQTRLLSPYPSLACRYYPRFLWGSRKSYFFWYDQRSQLYVSNHSQIKNQTSWLSISIGCSGTPTCAVCSMHSYLCYYASLSPIPPNSYLFALPNGSPLLKSVLNQQSKCLVSSINLDPSRYSTHSMCTGVATTVAIAGFNEIQVNSIG